MPEGAHAANAQHGNAAPGSAPSSWDSKRDRAHDKDTPGSSPALGPAPSGGSPSLGPGAGESRWVRNAPMPTATTDKDQPVWDDPLEGGDTFTMVRERACALSV